MSLNLEPRIKQALVDVLQQALARGEQVSLPGFGTFRVAHQSATVERQPDGKWSILPPRRSVAFEADPDSR